MKKYSELRKSKRPSLERLLPLNFPISIYIETTNRCNFRCRYCPMSIADYANISGGLKTMEMTQFQKICNDIQSGEQLKVLRFYLMGEPLINRNLTKMITLACKMKLAKRTELTTNASLLNEEKAEAIIDSGLTYFRVSISSVDQKQHEYITQTNISIDQIYKNIKRFKQIRDKKNQQKPFLYIKMIDRFDEEENSNFLHMYQQLGDEVVIEKPMNWDNYHDYDFQNAAYEGKKVSALEKLYPYNKSVCPSPFYTLAINVNGDVTVCCVDWNKSTCIGNVFELDLKSIWEGNRLRNFRQLHISRNKEQNTSCDGCKFLYTIPDKLDNMSKSKIATIIGEGNK